MMLSDQDLISALGAGDIKIDPFDEGLVKRNSYLLRLHHRFRRLSAQDLFDTADPDHYRRYAGKEFSAPSIDVDSDSLVLATSLERVALGPGYAGVLSGVSNIARLGVTVHATSTFVNADFGSNGSPSRVVFELSTVGGRRVRLYEGTPLCHIALVRLITPTGIATPSARTGQDGPDPSTLLAQFGTYYVPADKNGARRPSAPPPSGPGAPVPVTHIANSSSTHRD